MNEKWNIPVENENKIKKTRLIISGILGIIGLLIIISQLSPLASSYIDGLIQQIRTDLKLEPVPESYKTYIEKEFAYYDPGKSFFANLNNEITTLQYTYNPQTQSLKEVLIDKEYNKPMYIDIESIGIKDIKISPNVESYDEDIYNTYLKSGLAHFKGTPLPGDGGNSFIYGHSAVDSFFSNHSNLPETIFSRLGNIDISQKVIVKKDDKILEYIVRSKKIVSPEDFTILQPQQDKETLTMMTCWPLGIGTKRLVVVAEKQN